MKVKMLYFAQVAEKTGVSKEEIEVSEGSKTNDLIDLLKEKYPDLKDLVFKISVNQELKQDNVELADNFEIALLPPFAGG